MTFDTKLDCTIQKHHESGPRSATGARLTPTPDMYGPLEQAYDAFNERLFDGKLPGCLLTLQRERRNSYGYYSPKRWVSRDGKFADEIALNPNHFAVVPMLEALQTLAHEMCHAYQHIHGKPGRRGYHNKEFAAIMHRIGLQTSATGKPGGKTTGESMSDYPIPGGRFLQIVDELLAQGFTLAWMDRFPPAAIVLQAAAHADAPVDLGANASEQLAAASQALTVEALAALSVRAGDAPLSAPTRTKYTCACGDNIWGKKGILATCGVCNEDFLAQT
ncbi:SprT family zinc-dependent metalloprotease [Ralstonia insidiosa]|uniref:SprT family zinc-dependent metalloprotease n=2 Tax=Ralstonia insidiosa TaxID=190721 RepID=A0A848P5G4_9RALS|nr:SprT family zinc-dependent metalloprotease [Ralstonia insidiosa]